MAFVDFKVTTMAIFPHRANYIVSIDGFIKRDWLLTHAGGICKRKFTNDVGLVREIIQVLNVNKDILCIYPEARYSEAGTTAILPPSLGKLVKMVKVPVVVLNMHGNYLHQPMWNLHKRDVDLSADMTQIVRQDEVNTLTYQEINERIVKAFQYDEYKYQQDNHIKIDYEGRAEGLHHILYQCPSCKKENMDSKGHEIWCNECHKKWSLDEYGKLHASEGETEFDHVPDWYEFEREQVRQQILTGNYAIKTEAIVDSLPNAKGLITLGKATFIHNQDGFTLEGDFDGEHFLLQKPVNQMYSIHIEYNFHGHDEAISLSTLEDTYFIYPLELRNIATKVHFATEELYKLEKTKA
jgi:hypothetical protein